MFQQRDIVNGAMLRSHLGRPVSIVVKVIGSYAGTRIKAQTSDNLDINVVFNESLSSRPPDWIEVIGIPESPDTIRAKEVILFQKGEEEFDSNSHNIMLQMFHNCRDVYSMG